MDSIISQEYQNLEIIISDNASTDGTREICREYAQKDSRIRLFEGKFNIGPLKNHELAFQVSQGDFFTWFGGHDYVHPSFINKTLEVLLENPSVMMCCTQSVFIDEDNNITRTTKGGLDTRGLPPVERFKTFFNFITTGGTANVFYALYRSDVLINVEIRKTVGSDIIMLSELTLLGEVYQIQEVLYYRLVEHNLKSDERVERWVRLIIQPKGFSVKSLLPHLYWINEFFSMIEESSLSFIEKQALFEEVIKEVYRIADTIKTQVKKFNQKGSHVLLNSHEYSDLKNYHVIKLLEAIQIIEWLGFVDADTIELKIVCLSTLESGRIIPWQKKLCSLFRTIYKI